MVKKKHALALFPLALCFSSAHVLAAATNADLEKRLQDQEKKILRLENQLKGTRSAVKENRGRISDMTERLKINGFMTAGVATNDGDAVTESIYGISDDYSTAAVSKLGIQMTFEVSENFSATAQLVSKGTDDYQIEAEWAYLTYQATNDLRFNFGRQRIPYYLLSEYLDVGYALPWVIAPIELYNIPISNTDGVSAVYDFAVGPVNFAWQTYAGASSGATEQLDAEFTQNQSWGTNLVAEIDSWTFRVGYNASRLDADPFEGGLADQLVDAIERGREIGPELGVAAPASWVGDTGGFDSEYFSAGFMFDNGSLLVMGEISNTNVDDTFQPLGDAGYLTVGYRFGKWMPHVTYAKFYTDSKNDKQVREIQAYADALGKAAYARALGLNSLVNIAPLFAGVPANVVIPAQTCAGVPAPCSTTQLAQMSVRDELLSAATGYSETIYNNMESQIQEQQSYTIGLTYDVTPRVKAKAQVTHYEGFGSGNYQSLGTSDFTAVPALGATTYSGFSSAELGGNGRFQGDPDAAGNHTAIYSFSIDAVF